MRGLKFVLDVGFIIGIQVAPLAGAWIEIYITVPTFSPHFVAPLAGAWIEITTTLKFYAKGPVAPLAGAWIEISLWRNKKSLKPSRTPRGCVD